MASRRKPKEYTITISSNYIVLHKLIEIKQKIENTHESYNPTDPKHPNKVNYTVIIPELCCFKGRKEMSDCKLRHILLEQRVEGDALYFYNPPRGKLSGERGPFSDTIYLDGLFTLVRAFNNKMAVILYAWPDERGVGYLKGELNLMTQAVIGDDFKNLEQSILLNNRRYETGHFKQGPDTNLRYLKRDGYSLGNVKDALMFSCSERRLSQF